MSETAGCTHDFSYVLLKDAKDHYFGRVLEIPQVAVQGESKSDIDTRIPKSTEGYLKAAPKLHELVIAGQLKPQSFPVDSSLIIGTHKFKVRC